MFISPERWWERSLHGQAQRSSSRPSINACDGSGMLVIIRSQLYPLSSPILLLLIPYNNFILETLLHRYRHPSSYTTLPHPYTAPDCSSLPPSPFTSASSASIRDQTLLCKPPSNSLPRFASLRAPRHHGSHRETGLDPCRREGSTDQRLGK